MAKCIALMREAAKAAIYRTMEEIVRSCKPFDGPVRTLSVSSLPTMMKRWKQHFPTILKGVICDGLHLSLHLEMSLCSLSESYNLTKLVGSVFSVLFKIWKCMLTTSTPMLIQHGMQLCAVSQHNGQVGVQKNM